MVRLILTWIVVIAAMERASSPQLKSLDANNYTENGSRKHETISGNLSFTIRAMFTSIGHSETFSPMFVKRPSGSSIPEATSPSRARNTLSAGGLVTHSNFMRSSIPNDFSCNIGVVRSVRVNSGDVVTGRESRTEGG
jgi:hypothetical protein